jgi:hypothetical protein
VDVSHKLSIEASHTSLWPVTKEVIATNVFVLYSHSGPVGTSAAALQPKERDEQIQLPYYDSAQDPVVRDSVHGPAV